MRLATSEAVSVDDESALTGPSCTLGESAPMPPKDVCMTRLAAEEPGGTGVLELAGCWEEDMPASVMGGSDVVVYEVMEEDARRAEDRLRLLPPAPVADDSREVSPRTDGCRTQYNGLALS